MGYLRVPLEAIRLRVSDSLGAKPVNSREASGTGG